MPWRIRLPNDAVMVKLTSSHCVVMTRLLQLIFNVNNDHGFSHVAHHARKHSCFVQNKQVVTRRLTAVAMQLAFGRPRASSGDGAWPPPSFLTQSVQTSGSSMIVNVTLATETGMPFKLTFGATIDMKNQSSAVCPPTFNCSEFEVLTNDGTWHEAHATIASDGHTLVLTSSTAAAPTDQAQEGAAALYAVGSRYAWGAWPLATLFTANDDGTPGLPVLPWQQALTMSAP